MKVIYLADDQVLETHKIEKLVHEAWDGDFAVTSDLDLALQSKEESPLIFIHCEGDLKKIDKIHKALAAEENIVRVMVCEKLSIKDLKKHQFSELAAHAYLRWPLKAEQLKDVIIDLQQTHSSLGGEGLEANTSTKNPEELTFVGTVGKKKVK